MHSGGTISVTKVTMVTADNLEIISLGGTLPISNKYICMTTLTVLSTYIAQEN